VVDDFTERDSAFRQGRLKPRGISDNRWDPGRPVCGIECNEPHQGATDAKDEFRNGTKCYVLSR
jgi:hypothetical protein